jgi:type IV secretory pathway VirB2 component (pilin)
MNRRSYLTVALAMAFVLLADTAFAQAVGGGNGGLLNTIIQWVATNLLQGIIMIGVIVVGCMMIAGRHTLAGVVTMIVGGLVIANYNAIAALMPLGG